MLLFPRELVSFVRPRGSMRFDPRHVKRSPPIGKRFDDRAPVDSVVVLITVIR